jgi:hypothetical protein
MSKKELATLIDAYADAKSSKNQHLMNVMISQLERTLNEIFPESQEESDPATEF